MIKSKTYQGTEGLNYIQAPELAYTTLYVVKKEGVQHDKWLTGDTNRRYVYFSSIGRIYFPTVFNSGEKAFFIYKESSGVGGPIPGVCEPVSIIVVDMPIALVGQPYSYSVLLSGTGPHTLTDLVAPSWMAGHIYMLTQVRLFGTPDAESAMTVTFNVTNACGTDAFSKPLSVMSGDVNFYVNDFLTAIILSVTGPEYVLTSGSIPTVGPIPVEGIHAAYTGTIAVRVRDIVFPLQLKIKRNSIELESIPVSVDGTYTFATQSYLSTDIIEILLTS